MKFHLPFKKQWKKVLIVPELICLASNIRKEVFAVLDFFSFLKKYGKENS
jgi:hypothetical protein